MLKRFSSLSLQTGISLSNPLLLAPIYHLPTTNYQLKPRKYSSALYLHSPVKVGNEDIGFNKELHWRTIGFSGKRFSNLVNLWTTKEITELVIRTCEIYWFMNCINPITFTQYFKAMTYWFYLIRKVICQLNCSLNISLVTPKLYSWNARQWISILRN